MSEEKSVKRTVWRLPVLMAEQGLRSVTDLQRLLEGVGYKVSSPQLWRVVYEPPKFINIELINALLNALDCTPVDLLGVEMVDPSAAPPEKTKPGKKSEEPAPPKKTKKAPKGKGDAKEVSAKELIRLVGPKLSPFPLPDKKE